MTTRMAVNQAAAETPKELQAKLLRTAYQALKQEWDTLNDLLDLDPRGMGRTGPDGKHLEEVAEHLRRFGMSLDERLGTAQKELSAIAKVLYDPSTNDQPQTFKLPSPADLKEAWSACAVVRQEFLQPLTNELLAVIGGVYLKQEKLDNLFTEKGRETRSRSYSDLASEMVRDLGMGYACVLIVGEEHSGRCETNVVRLRFPACDIWNLPFAAHEQAFVLASSNQAGEAFKQFREEIRGSVDPSKHTDPSTRERRPPADAGCYLDDVRAFWTEYEKAIAGEEHGLHDQTARLNKLRDQQDSFLCRLYADAYATYFVGPAYVHALLHLRFMPEPQTSRSPYQPPFALRFVFAMETLRWMNDQPAAKVAGDQPFRREVFDEPANGKPGGIPHLWRLALESIGIADPGNQIYNNLATSYRNWLDRTKGCMPSAQRIGKKAYENWVQARKLEDRLAEPLTEGQLDFPPSEWSIINAAWTLRWLKPSETDKTIYDNALKLLIDRDLYWLPKGKRDALSGQKAYSADDRRLATDAANKVTRALVNDSDDDVAVNKRFTSDAREF